MTTTDTVTRSHPGGGAADFVAAGGRKGSIVRARRHTRFVKVLRWLFPMTTVGLVIVYGLAMMDTAGIGSSLPAAALQKILPADLKMHNPHYDGFAKDGSSYVVDAKSAQQHLAQPNVILLDDIRATLTQPDKTKTLVTAVTGKFDHKANVLELSQAIDVNSESGLKAKLTQATIDTKESVVVSKEPVVVEFPSGTIRSKAMTLKQKTKDVAFTGDVKTLLKPPPPNPDATAAVADAAAAVATAAGTGPSAAAAAGAKTGGLFKPSSEPIDIQSESLNIWDSKKLAVFAGGVKASQSGAVMTSPSLEVTYENDESKGGAEKTVAAATSAMGGGKIQRISATGPVVMTQPEGQRVEAGSAVFDAVKESAVLTGDVVMTGPNDQRAQGDRADLDQQADTALLTGRNVLVQQGVNVLKGRRFFVDRKNGQAQLTAPPGDGEGPGRITAHFMQGKPKSGSPKTTAAPANAGFATFKTDPDAPIDIEAESMDVDDHTRTATFLGDVHAVQGTFAIRTAELIATYSGDGALADVNVAAKPDEKSGKKPTELTRIDAKKDVVVTSKDGQMARGDWATFDRKANTVVVGGDVSLSDGGNMVRGSRLTIDMVSGESRIDTDPSNKMNAQPSAGGWMTTGPAAAAEGSRGRPSAILFPKSMQNGAAGHGPKDAKEKSGAAPDGWSAKSDPWGASPQN